MGVNNTPISYADVILVHSARHFRGHSPCETFPVAVFSHSLATEGSVVRVRGVQGLRLLLINFEDDLKDTRKKDGQLDRTDIVRPGTGSCVKCTNPRYPGCRTADPTPVDVPKPGHVPSESGVRGGRETGVTSRTGGNTSGREHQPHHTLSPALSRRQQSPGTQSTHTPHTWDTPRRHLAQPGHTCPSSPSLATCAVHSLSNTKQTISK